MNTNRTNTPLATSATALAACLVAILAGATACGTQNGTTTTPAAIGRHATSQSIIDSYRAEETEYLRQLHAKQAAQSRPHMFGDDQRQPSERAQNVFGDDRRQPNG